MGHAWDCVHVGQALLSLPRTQCGCPHSECAVFVWLCSAPQRRGAPGVVCGVVTGLGVSCVGGSHLMFYVIQGVHKR